MTVKKFQQQIVSENGGILYLPPDPSLVLTDIPKIFEQSATLLYPIGTRFVDGKVTYHYFKAGGTINYVLAGIFSNVAMLESAVNTYGATLAGATTIKVDGASAGVPAADAWAGGTILVIGAGSSERVMMRIVSNLAAETASPYAVELTLEQPLPFDISNDVNCEIMPNRYASAITAWGDTLLGTMWTCIGIPARKMTANYYGWVKTWGMAFAARAGTDTTTDADRTVIWNTDGSIGPADEKWGPSTSYSHQLAGYALAINGTAGGWFHMMCDP